jgi:hypothetical protein
VAPETLDAAPCTLAEFTGTLAPSPPLIPAVVAVPPSRSRPGVAQEGEEATRAACGHSRASSRQGKLAGASPPHRSAPPRRAPSLLRLSHSRRPRWLRCLALFASVFSAHEIESRSSIPRFTAATCRLSPPSSAARHRSGTCVHPQPLDPDLATLINPLSLFKPTATASHPI